MLQPLLVKMCSKFAPLIKPFLSLNRKEIWYT